MHFSDADMESLTFTAESANTAVATVMVDGSTLTVQGVMPGNTMITVTATDMLGAYCHGYIHGTRQRSSDGCQSFG